MSEYKDKFEVIARVVMIKDGKILLCKGNEKNYYFFPGGHVEKGERTQEALKRELKEELGMNAGDIDFIGASENIFEDAYLHHEINLVFKIDVSESEFKSREDHLEFAMLSFADFKKAKVLPETLKNAVMGWLENGKEFWRSEE